MSIRSQGNSKNSASVGEERPRVFRRDLKRECLSYVEVLAQSVSVIAPSTVPAAILGLIFAVAGNGTWLSFLLGMVGLLFVSGNINQFARRSASPGSLYTYIVRGLGPTAGVLSGWALLFAYLFTGMSTLCGFGIIAGVLLRQVGFHADIPALFIIGASTVFAIAYRDIQLSAKMMLIFEGVALVVIMILGMLIWQQKGFALDTQQLTLAGATPGGVSMGSMLVIFAFSGFESSTALGQEAKDPLWAIPRSVTQSIALTGIVFIFMAYVITLGFADSTAKLDKTEAPLNFLADAMGWGTLGFVLNVGVLLSFLSCTLACVNSTARIFFSMSRHGLLFYLLGAAHEKNETPHIAVGLAALITFFIPTLLYFSGVSAFDGQAYFSTLCTFGFLVAYILISLAAPIYLRSIGRLNNTAILYSVLGVGFMILPILGTVGIPGSVLFPPPAFPNNLLVWLFVVYMAIGFGWLIVQRAHHPKMMSAMTKAVENVEVQFAEAQRMANRPVR